MMPHSRALCLGLFALLLTATTAMADASDKYTLRYKFRQGETLRWNVVHRSQVRSSVSGTTKSAETLSKSVKAWTVREVKPDGTMVFEHMVESVDMRQKLTGCEETRYNSQTDEKAPDGFADVADSVGVPLSTVTMDATGVVLDREQAKVKAGRKNEGHMTIPLPKKPIAVGDRWSFPYQVNVKLESGGTRRVDTLQTFKLLSVKTGVASIQVATQILTPIDDPALESQLIQRESEGTVRFDIDAGRVLSQQMDVDKRVVGFRGQASSLHYLTRFTEELQPDIVKTASR